MRFSKLILSLILLVPAVVSGEETKKLIEKIEARYNKKTFQADFFQESTLKALDIKQTAGGFVIFSHPGKMYWQYNFPEKKEIITNSEKVWLISSKHNQVTIMDAGDYFKAGSGGSFLSNIDSIKKDYNVKAQKSDDKTRGILTLIPKNKKDQISKIIISFMKKNGQILRVTTINKANDSTVFIFKNEQFLKNLDGKIFNYTLPENPINSEIVK
ncbi:MAG: lipoprotein carrier protein LolA [Deltaproteobacteria bacterium]|nr:MAG: lipoprotein carrier protein LolA [Deltaproteobacteria bacterium]